MFEFGVFWLIVFGVELLGLVGFGGVVSLWKVFEFLDGVLGVLWHCGLGLRDLYCCVP